MIDSLKTESYNGKDIFFAKGDKVIVAYINCQNKCGGSQYKIIGIGSTKDEAFENSKQNLQLSGGKFKRTDKGMIMTGNFQGQNYGRKIGNRDNY